MMTSDLCFGDQLWSCPFIEAQVYIPEIDVCILDWLVGWQSMCLTVHVSFLSFG